MIKKLNRTLFELWVGIAFLYPILMIVIFFVPSKLDYAISLSVGIVTALVASWHMWWSFDRALSRDVEGAMKSVRIQYLYRYLFLILVLGVVGMIFKEYVLATFAGISCMKFSAYLQPITKKVSTLVYGVEILPDIIYPDSDNVSLKIEDTAEGQR
ncbi:MAG: ATP synthase subunit I [Lachnospiraceae bacterium]|nr:ATP synthase subunit I [Lachnospiraceae bacterium]